MSEKPNATHKPFRAWNFCFHSGVRFVKAIASKSPTDDSIKNTVPYATRRFVVARSNILFKRYLDDGRVTLNVYA